MSLANAVKDARHTSQTITWTDEAGNAQDLTGATITGVIRDQKTAVVRAITGSLDITDATAGEFTWAYSAADVASAGYFEVQFVATYGDDLSDATLVTAWTVKEKLEVPS